MEDLQDSKNRVWHYLGIAFIDSESKAKTGKLIIKADVKGFRRFVLSGNYLTQNLIFNNKPIPGVWHLSPEQDTPGDDDPDALLALVSLKLIYIYDLPQENGDQYLITNTNAARFWNDTNYDFLEMDTSIPSSAIVTLTPYSLSMGMHSLGVDMYVYFRWTDPDPVSHGRVLRLRIDQDPIPAIPPDAPLLSELQWRLLGRPFRLTGLRASTNELRFSDGINGFLESLPRGDVGYKFRRMLGIRATNVYAPNKEFPGMQVKLKMTNEQLPRLFVSIALGELLEYNKGLHGKLIEVYYRWCSTALELWVRLAPSNNNNHGN